MTLYPTQIDGYASLPILVDLVSPVRATDINKLRNAIVEIERELGTNPSSTYSTVKDRLDAIELAISEIEDGYGDGYSGGDDGYSGAEPDGYGTDTVQLASNETTDLNGPVLVGSFYMDASEYSDIKFLSISSISNSGLTGTINLYNLSDASTVINQSITSTTPTSQESTSLTLPSGNKIYEVRISVSGGTSEADRIILNWAGFKLTA